jgi:NADPH-dependent glutamate synthase beta subunit-like oxidoreductase/dihydroorotate dehydrogenase
MKTGGILMKNEICIPVEIGGVRFKNPFYVASGPTTKSVRQLLRIEQTGWAAASIKLTIDPAPYINRVPRYAIFNDRNALCFTAEKRLTFDEGLRLVDDAKKVLKELILFANITYAGDKGVEGWVNMAKKFEEVGADIIELNMCCPNMSYNVELSKGDDKSCLIRTGASLGQEADVVAEIVKEIKKAIKIPLFVKLTPEGGRSAQIAKVLYEAGADAVGGTANRLGMPPIDLDNPGKAAYHLQDEISMSCHSGAWLKPLALRDTYEIRKVNGPEPKIMATGGIRNATDAIEMIMCGADLLGICAATLISGFGFIGDVIKDLKEYMDKHNFKNLREMRDLVVPLVKSAPELTLYDGYAKIKNPELAAPCKTACPHHVPAQAYVRAVARKDFKRAYELIMEKNPLQSVCGWVCNHPCEQACTRGDVGTPVPIKDIKRFVIEYGEKMGWKPEIKINGKRTEKVAVIGSGPAGLSAAWNLKKAGYEVTVFEKEKFVGGMLRYGIPAFRMNHAILDKEIEVLKDLGVSFITGMESGMNISMDSLKEQGFSAIFVAAAGKQEPSMNIAGENAVNVYSVSGFLKSVHEKNAPCVGEKVVVSGDGLSSLDAARTAVRLGARDVLVTFSKTREELNAMSEELIEAEAEGVKTMYSVSPKEIIAENGRAVGVKLAKLAYGTKGGKRLREFEASEFVLDCDMVISACERKTMKSQCAEYFQDLGLTVNCNPVTGKTGIDGLFAAADMSENISVIAAVAAGNRVASVIDRYIAGVDATLEFEDKFPVVSKESVLKRTGYFKDKAKPDLCTVDGEERIKSFSTYKRTLTEEEAVFEAQRCLNCGCGEGCGICASICGEFAINLKKTDYWEVNSEECVACGMCYNRCPNNNIEMVDCETVVK